MAAQPVRPLANNAHHFESQQVGTLLGEFQAVDHREGDAYDIEQQYLGQEPDPAETRGP